MITGGAGDGIPNARHAKPRANARAKPITAFTVGVPIRVRVAGLAQADKNQLAKFGRIDDEGEQLTFASLDPGRVPELVATIVSMGGRVYEVAPRHQTLEDRFLQLLEDEEK